MIGEPLFTPEDIWFPTDHGIFRYRRNPGAFSRIALGGVFHDIKIGKVSLAGGRLRIETVDGAAGGTWNVDPKTMEWGKP